MDEDRNLVDIRNLANKIDEVDKRVRKLQQTVNNGLHHQTKENTKTVEKLCQSIDNINRHIERELGKKEGITLIFDIIRKWGAWIITLITLMLYLNEVGII